MSKRVQGLIAGTFAAIALLHSATAQTSTTTRSNTPPPLPGLTLNPPTQFFRQLLTNTPAERERLLANRTPEQRALLLIKIGQYEAMPFMQRDWIFRALDLRYYLVTLMPLPPTNRAVLMASLPQTESNLVKLRLRYWDKLPAEMQTNLMAYQHVLHLVVPTAGGGYKVVITLTNLPPNEIKRLDAEVDRWKALTTKQQDTIYEHFQRVFELSAPPFPSLPAPIPKTPANIKKWSEAERAVSRANLQKFIELPAEKKEQFRIAIDVWRAMTEAQREAWRQAVYHEPPLPLPPGLDRFPSPQTVAVSTNK